MPPRRGRSAYVTPVSAPRAVRRPGMMTRAATRAARVLVNNPSVGSALLRAVPYGRAALGAAAAARTIQRAYRRYRTRQVPRPPAMRRTNRAFAGVSTHYYRGRFRKPRKTSKPKTQTKYLSNGYLLTSEVFGKVDDLDCVYIGHSTYNRTQFARVIACAVLRKLLKKAGFNPDSPDQEIPFNGYNDSSGFELRWVRIAGDGTILPSTYVVPNNTSLETLATASGWQQAVYDLMNTQDGYSRGDFDRIALYSQDFNVTSTGRLAAEVNLRTEVLELYSQSSVVIQNRTKSAVGGSDSTETVDNQPLKGYCYNFAGGVPQQKQTGVSGLTRVIGDGIILQQSVDLSPATLFKEPPVPKTFSNCFASSYVRLDPGFIKRGSIVSKWRGYFNNIIFGKLKAVTPDGANQNVSYSAGKCQLFALEEALNSGSTNKITVNYECEKKIGAMLITGKKPVMLTGWHEQERNNISA